MTEEDLTKSVYVVGHRNPDTDSICSAIAYANLKNKMTNSSIYRPKRAGGVNPETEFVLNYFKVPKPAYVTDVRTQVRDVEFRRTEGVDGSISLKKAWESMRSIQAHTLPIINKEKEILGVITIGDIAKSYMEVYDNKIISAANTPYTNIIETLDGEMPVGDLTATVSEGKVLIAAANPDLMESYIEEKDIVILGNRYESQLCAIEMGAQCIIVCDGATVSYTISKMAESKGCAIIKTPYDTYTAARLINQSMPIQFFMCKNGIIMFTVADFIEEIREIMTKNRFRDFPVLDLDGKYLGMISRRDLLDAKKKKLILVDHNERSQAVDGIEDTELQEIIDHHRLGGLQTMSPIFFRNQPLGCTATIVYQMFIENEIEIEPHIAGLLCSAIISDTLVYRSPTCTSVDKEAAEALAKIAGIEVEAYAREMFAAGSNLRGKSPEEIFYQDFKKFTAGDVTFAVGQISSMNKEELEGIKEKLLSYMDKSFESQGVSMIFFMLTDIMEESTDLLYYGEKAEETVMQAFHVENPEEGVILAGVVSRKKQLIPALMLTLQQDAEA
ncbi:putative manganese-dependent inorganic diphosphatase [Velocimicrobium porci]|uniref:inorganic diphosphatase n=1 Tax=Velocimicrobium porci TaxID=2606634 RepID=A0A6L5XWK7_9FIRM|nr:putative manganese-dependent inorganic diphosphatase [Velocimicrobium porci]MSS63132.1 putative manganese-dependent inorganic diphosphatase [Velocimicrobium porci]